jgi:hypothetical protein
MAAFSTRALGSSAGEAFPASYLRSFEDLQQKQSFAASGGNDLEDFITAASAIGEFLGVCAEFASKQHASIPRLPATSDVPAIANRSSAVALLADAMSPSSRVDFRSITEICQRLVDFPSEVPEAVKFVANAWTDRRSDRQRVLKALTIANEMLYDEAVTVEMAKLTHSVEQLYALQCCRCDNAAEHCDYGDCTNVGTLVESNIRLLAAEVARRLAVPMATETMPDSISGLIFSLPRLAVGGYAAIVVNEVMIASSAVMRPSVRRVVEL